MKISYKQIIDMLKTFDYDKNTKEDLIYFLSYILDKLI